MHRQTPASHGTPWPSAPCQLLCQPGALSLQRQQLPILRVLHLRQLLIAGLHVLQDPFTNPGPCTRTACTGLLDPWASLRPPPVSASHPVMLPVPTAPGTPFLCPPASLSCPTRPSLVAPRQLGGLLPTPHRLQPPTQPCSPPCPPAGCAGSGEVALPSPSSPSLAASPCVADTGWLVRSTPTTQTQQITSPRRSR